ncbi:hypothetical protein [Alkalihalobacillus sp. TS-13]|uniref:cytochrome bd oxidase small subunit CydS n=1 Tax=Alkalihalobacillus sp. TS-13 TaxID=2842455 RepID=UPI001C889DDE|nr:hypothetical protein [Alkalihalobacillus sp. TS-13]
MKIVYRASTIKEMSLFGSSIQVSKINNKKVRDFMQDFLIFWAPPIVLIIAIVGLFIWGAKK